MNSFIYTALSARVLFGSGTSREVASEAERLDMHRALVLSTAEQCDMAKQVRSSLGPRAQAIFSGARMHTPIETTLSVLEIVRSKRIDGLVAIGGGSTTGLAKAIAFRTGLPQIIIPTTYAGSEATPILGETAGGVKTTVSSPQILPETILYDVDLTLGLPVPTSITSGFNAIAHAAEALYARDGNPVTALMAEEAVRDMVKALPLISEDPHGIEGRSGALRSAWLCGLCLGTVGMALHHKLCHTLGGSFGLPHAETHTIILPHALAYNLPASPVAEAALARATGEKDPALALHTLARRLGAPTGLRDIGLDEADIEKAAKLALESPYWNPRPIEAGAIRGLLRRAWASLPPSAD